MHDDKWTIITNPCHIQSTTDCIFVFHSIITKLLSCGKKVYTAFIDYEKCFDKINQAYLFQSLLQKNVSCKIVNALRSMYSCVKSYVRFQTDIHVSECIDSNSGVKQGDPSSPLLAMIFMNDIVHAINTNIDGVFSIDDVKLFILLYADDQVVFSTLPQSLQSMLNDMQIYCNTWGLKVNEHKSKIMIFVKGNRPTNCKFYLNGKEIEIVKSFKYLGVHLFKNANWYRTQKRIAEHASFSMYKLFSIFASIELPVSEKCKLFDTLVGSVLNYGSEVLGAHEGKDIENVHAKFCRRILNVRKSTNLIALYGELQRIPMFISRKLTMLKYWLRLLKLQGNCVPKIVYTMLRHDADSNRSYNGYNCASGIKSMLESNGLLYMWTEPEVIIPNFNVIKQRIIDTYRQRWHENVSNSQQLISYYRLKQTHDFEKYLDIIKETKFRSSLTRFRVSSHYLRIESGRYENIPRENRICINCPMKVVENEYHFLLVCPMYRHLRIKYFKPYFCHWPSLYTLMSSTNTKTILNLAKFIYFANKLRN